MNENDSPLYEISKQIEKDDSIYYFLRKSHTSDFLDKINYIHKQINKNDLICSEQNEIKNDSITD